MAAPVKPGQDPHDLAGILIAQGWFQLLTGQMDIDPAERTDRMLGV